MAHPLSSLPPAAGAVPSPCINVCRMDPASGWCEGCLRTIDEIAAWGQLGDEAKRAVWAQLEARRVARAANAGCAGRVSGTSPQGAAR